MTDYTVENQLINLHNVLYVSNFHVFPTPLLTQYSVFMRTTLNNYLTTLKKQLFSTIRKQKS